MPLLVDEDPLTLPKPLLIHYISPYTLLHPNATLNPFIKPCFSLTLPLYLALNPTPILRYPYPLLKPFLLHYVKPFLLHYASLLLSLKPCFLAMLAYPYTMLTP